MTKTATTIPHCVALRCVAFRFGFLIHPPRSLPLKDAFLCLLHAPVPGSLSETTAGGCEGGHPRRLTCFLDGFAGLDLSCRVTWTRYTSTSAVLLASFVCGCLVCLAALFQASLMDFAAIAYAVRS